MIIICNECDTSFNLDENLLKQTGSKVRCSKCKNVFLAYPSSIFDEPDESSELKTELEAAITDEEIEWSELYKVKEVDTEPQEIESYDIDNLLEINEDLKAENESEEFKLELDLELEPEMNEAPAETEIELELESRDKTDSEISVDEELEGIEISFDSEPDIFYQKEDKETETKIEEGIEQDKTSEEYAAEKIEEDGEESSKAFNMGVLSDEQEAEKEIKPVDKTEKGALTEKSELQKVAAKKTISSIPVFLLLLAVLLISGAYGTYLLLDSVGINIPFISDFLKPEVQDAGNLKIYTSDINNKFAENSKIGKLLVITGKAKNEYSDTRSYISITGKLYTKGKILLKTKTVYCGTILSELDLITMDIDSINNRLSNRFDDNKSNVKVKSGLIIPFMIVFDNLPENLDEFTIEVAGSFPSSEI